MALTKKQQTFVDEYLIDLNATQAAIRAGYSSHTAKDIGCENLSKPNIRACVDKAMAERSKRTGVNQDRVIRELAKIAFVNAANLINFKCASVEEDATEDDTAAIQSVKVKITPSEDGDIIEREVKLYDKRAALVDLGKHLGMFIDRLDINLPITVIIQDDYGDGD